jgi:ribosome-associated protein
MNKDEHIENDFEDGDGDSDEEFISKTALKKAMHELQDLSEKLLNFNKKQLAELPLSDFFLENLDTTKKLKSGNARRRQIQLLGKLMRDEDIESINVILEKKQNLDRSYPALTQKAQDWCEKLITEGREAQSIFINEHPNCDRQRLGQLIRNIQKDIKKAESDGKTSKLSNKDQLFKMVFELLKEKML